MGKKIVRCIETNKQDCIDSLITYGKEYKVIEEDHNFYYITLDTGEKGRVYKFRFEEVNQKTQNNMNNQQYTFAVYSENQKLLFAFLDTCIELGMPEETEWNNGYRKKKSIDHIYFDTTLQIHAHNCDVEVIYNLPQDWGAALEKAKEIYLASKYTGKWKVGDEITLDQLNHAPENSIVYGDGKAFNERSFYDHSRIIEAIRAINGAYYGEISDTRDLWINLDQIPTQDEVLLAKAIKESGVKIGDKELFSNLQYFSKSEAKSAFLVGITCFGDNEGYYITGFERINGINWAIVKHKTTLDGNGRYMLLDQVAANKKGVAISGYKAEVVTENGVKLIKFGCKRFSKQSLASLYDLLAGQDSEMKVDLKINDTQITLEMIEKLINMLD